MNGRILRTSTAACALLLVSSIAATPSAAEQPANGATVVHESRHRLVTTQHDFNICGDLATFTFETTGHTTAVVFVGPKRLIRCAWWNDRLCNLEIFPLSALKVPRQWLRVVGWLPTPRRGEERRDRGPGTGDPADNEFVASRYAEAGWPD